MRISSASLVPENDASVLFTTAGMHPLVPYLLGQSHPSGYKRLTDVQKCLRTDDIDNVGDGFHHTFFEMLGNWSLGDYWKEESLSWSYEFLTKELGIEPKKISVSCFAGDQDAPRDEEAAEIWRKIGIPSERIFFLTKKDNWWGPVGEEGPCGPDSEIFFDTGKPKCGPNCDVSCQCGKYVEIWNNVFMQYNRLKNGTTLTYEPLKQKNVDTGFGVDRVTAVTSGFGDDDYKTELWKPIMEKITELSDTGGKCSTDDIRHSRIVADHTRAAVFLIADGVTPSNVYQGYVLRRLIRRAVRSGKMLGIKNLFLSMLSDTIIENYWQDYPELKENREKIKQILDEEEKRFSQTIEKGTLEFLKITAKAQNKTLGPDLIGISGQEAFNLYQSFGFPIELTEEMAKENGLVVDKTGFEKAMAEHREKSQTISAGAFISGLADTSEKSIKYHTAAHLLHAAARKILGENIHQAGQNITAERLRFDLAIERKITQEEIIAIEKLVNEKIAENLAVVHATKTQDEARQMGAIGLFTQKYGDKVSVYSIGDFSKEFCAGPHVDLTGRLGRFKIIKEESAGRGIRRIYAQIS